MATRQRAFTLIELLVVMAIAAILSAIIFPVLARARLKARQTMCVSNLYQLSHAFEMYTQDYDETLPTYYWAEGRDGVPNSTTWWGGIYPYVRNLEVYECPSNRLPGHHTWQVWVDHTDGFANVPWLNITYGYNEPIGNQPGGLGLGRLGHTSDTVLLADASSTWLGGYWALPFPQRAKLYRVAYPNGGFPCACPPDDPRAKGDPVHDGGSNIAFADGHVKWVPAERVLTVSGGGALRYFENEW